MATVSYASPETSSLALFGQASHATMQYINQRASDFIGALSQSSAAAAEDFRARFGELTNGKMARAATALRNRVAGYFQEDAVRYLSTVGQIQNAPQQMVRWVMAHPGMRTLYQQDSIVGYGERYIDVDPGGVGKGHYDYRRATNGMLLKNDDGVYQATSYADKILPDEVGLSVVEQASIIRTWAVLDEALEEGVSDPSSEWNDMIS